MRGYDETKPVRIWVGSYGLYNDGYLAGDWFSLPMDRDELWKGINDACHVTPFNEEVGCFDYECDIHGVRQHMSEYMSIDGVNALAAALESMDSRMDEGFEMWLDTQVNLSMLEIASAAIDADNIPYYGYYFDGYGVENIWGYVSGDTMSNEEKYGRTLADAFGITSKLEEMGVEDYFDYKDYGSSHFDVDLGDYGYLDTNGNQPRTDLYDNALELLEDTGYYTPTES